MAEAPLLPPRSRRESNSLAAPASPPHSPDATPRLPPAEAASPRPSHRAEPSQPDPARPAADHWTDASGGDGCRKCAPGRCSSSAGPPRRSTTSPASAPGHLLELLQPRPHRGLARRRRRRPSPRQVHQPSPPLLRRQPLLVLEVRATRGPVCRPPAPPATGRPSSSPRPSDSRSRLKPPGKPPARDPHGPSWRRSGSADRATSARRPPAAAHRRSRQRAPRRSRPHDLRSTSSSPSSASFSALHRSADAPDSLLQFLLGVAIRLMTAWLPRGDSGNGRADEGRRSGPWPPPCGCSPGHRRPRR